MRRNPLSRLSDIYGRHGVVGAIRLVPQQARIVLRSWSPTRIRARRRDRAFDRQHGVETSRKVYLSELALDADTARHAICYQASGVDFTLGLIRRLEIRHEEYCFIDLGAGKGRTLLLASQFPFRRIIGVEVAKELTAIARRNIQTFRAPEQHCHALEAVWSDAAQYEFPDDPLVIYLTRSFDDVILGRVLDNLERSLRARWRDLLLVCIFTPYRALLDRVEFLRCTAEHDGGSILIYRPRESAAVSDRPTAPEPVGSVRAVF